MDAVPGVSMKDLAGGLYYLFSLRKGEQGCRPDAPAEEHSGCADVRCISLSSRRAGPLILKPSRDQWRDITRHSFDFAHFSLATW
jgi:hypothetical protein